MKLFKVILLIPILIGLMSCKKETLFSSNQVIYTFPDQSEPHEGTWLQWPHQYQYGLEFRNSLDPTWVALTKELISSENVHIIAYDSIEQKRIVYLLNDANIDQSNIRFYFFQTDDFWVRDNGPIFAYDTLGKVVIQDWGFNGWGNKAAFEKCNTIPSKIAQNQGRELIDLNNLLINEGGSVEVDGNGTLMACKSSILNRNRNPGMTTSQLEEIFTRYYGVKNFVWLDGISGMDITDSHIDGFARFSNKNTIVTINAEDLKYYYVKQRDINRLYEAKNIDGEQYAIVKLPLTANDVINDKGKNLGRASYCNYYIANTKVIVPIFNDPNDAIAIQTLQNLYPSRTVVGIDCRNLHEYGGLIHCITQQQPLE